MNFWQHRPKHIAEYLALRGIGGLVRVLPYRAALAVGAGIALLGFHVVRWRRAEAERRIREVFGNQKTAGEVRRIAWISMRNMCFNAVEALRLPLITKTWVEQHTDCGEIEKIREFTSKSGSILVVPHMGSWDLAGVAASLFGLPMFIIVGHQKNALTDAYINKMRGATGIDTIPRDSSALRSAIKRLKEGKMLVIMTDLRSKTPGVKVNFLGKDANLVVGMGMFARMAGVPIIPAIVTRIGWTRHQWRACEIIHPDTSLDRDVDVHRMTQLVMDDYERAIRAQPEQYFWYNKRWVLQPLPVEEKKPSSETTAAA